MMPTVDPVAAVDRLVETERASRTINTIALPLSVVLLLVAVGFLLLPGGARSTLVVAGVGVLCLAGYLLNRLGHNQWAAAILVTVLVVAPGVQPILAGDLSTDLTFAGVGGVLAMMFAEWRRRWFVVAATVAVTVAALVVSDPAATLPVDREGALTSGAALLALSVTTALFLLRGYREMAERAAAAQRISERRAAELAALNSSLARAVAEREAELARAIAARRDVAEQLADTVIRDPLTGLLNRRYLDEQLPNFAHAPASIAILDVDSFKEINEQWSYVVGDQVLRAIAATLAEQVRATDVIVRYGGEEFAVLMPGSTEHEARATTERLRGAVVAHDWHEIHADLSITVSAGVCVTEESAAGDDPRARGEEMLRRADANLQLAKASGRDRSVVSTCHDLHG